MDYNYLYKIRKFLLIARMYIIYDERYIVDKYLNTLIIDTENILKKRPLMNYLRNIYENILSHLVSINNTQNINLINMRLNKLYQYLNHIQNESLMS